MLQVGVDCEKISRFRKLHYGKNKRFYQRIFTQPEIDYCISYRDPYPRFAVRFAAKEATVKALNGIASLFYTDIEIQKDNKQKPRVHINRSRFKGMKRFRISLSLTHSDSYAIAFAVITDNNYGKIETAKVLKNSISYIKKKALK